MARHNAELNVANHETIDFEYDCDRYKATFDFWTTVIFGHGVDTWQAASQEYWDAVQDFWEGEQ